MMTTAVPDCPVDESFDPLSPEFLADPYAVLAGLPGDGAPVFFAPSIGYYVITSYLVFPTRRRCCRRSMPRGRFAQGRIGLAR